jgi:hypothetical protein
MKKINNVVIENQSPEFAVELKRFWERMGVDLSGYTFTQNSKELKIPVCYGVIDGTFSAYLKGYIPAYVQIFSHIPTLAELGLEEITFPCEMEVWDKDGDKKVKRKVIMTFEHNGGTRFIEFDESINEYFVYKNAQPIQSLTISELIKIASEVMGCKVILKEDKS